MTQNRRKKEFNAIGKYSVGIFAHPKIVFEIASWLNLVFKLYVIMEFERLKQVESQKCSNKR